LFITNEPAILAVVRTSRSTSLYLDRLRSLPFLREVSLRPAETSAGDALLELGTPRGTRTLLVEQKGSHLGKALIADLIIRTADHRGRPFILFAPYVSPEMAALLVEHRINFVDQAGNCHLDLGGKYVAHVEGRKLTRQPRAPRGRRGPGLRVVFAVLANPDLLDAPARELARVSGVSLGTVSNVVQQLREDRIVVRTKSRQQLARPVDLMERWVAGYAETLRPQLFIGRFQTPEQDPMALQNRLAALLGDGSPWGWGGAAAAFLLTRHYRSEETVLHVDTFPPELASTLKAAPYAVGRLTVLGVPAALAYVGPTPHVVHPLLIYAELMAAASDRAREAAGELRQRFLASRDDAAS
jgi:hypothetical protein